MLYKKIAIIVREMDIILYQDIKMHVVGCNLAQSISRRKAAHSSAIVDEFVIFYLFSFDLYTTWAKY